MSELKMVHVGTTRPEGMSLRDPLGLSLVIPADSMIEVPAKEALEALNRFPDIYCPELHVPKPLKTTIGDNEIGYPPQGIPTDRTRFNLVYGVAKDPQAVAETGNDAPTMIACPFCESSFHKAGIYNHVLAKHPDVYDAWLAGVRGDADAAATSARVLGEKAPGAAPESAGADEKAPDAENVPPEDDDDVADLEREIEAERLAAEAAAANKTAPDDGEDDESEKE